MKQEVRDQNLSHRKLDFGRPKILFVNKEFSRSP